MSSWGVSRRARVRASSRVRPGSEPRSGTPLSSHASSANHRWPTYSMPSNEMRQVTLKRRPSYSRGAMWGWTVSSRTGSDDRGVGWCGVAQERAEEREELRRLLDIRDVPAAVNDDAL